MMNKGSISVWRSGVVTGEDSNMFLTYQSVGDTRHPKVPVLNHIHAEPRIQALFIRYATDPELKDCVAFKLEAIDTIASIYGNFTRFMSYQFDFNYLMHGLNLDFLEDTLRFITSGRRDYSLLTWKELVVKNPDYIVRTNGHRRWQHVKSNFGINKYTDLEHYISMWCSQAGGFEDMLYTTWILFGSPESANALKD